MIKIILYSVAIGLLFAEFSGIPQRFARWLATKGFGINSYGGMSFTKRLPYKLKPFGCGMCLTFWVGLLLSIFSANFDLWEAFGIACISGSIAHLILTVYARINR